MSITVAQVLEAAKFAESAYNAVEKVDIKGITDRKDYSSIFALLTALLTAGGVIEPDLLLVIPLVQLDAIIVEFGKGADPATEENTTQLESNN